MIGGKLSELGASVMNLFNSSGGATTSNALGSPVLAPASAIPDKPANDGKLPTGEAELAAAKKAAETPLTEFADLFKVVEIDPAKKPVVEANPLDFDPNKLMEVAGKMDFTQGIPAELMAKAKGGDFEAQMQVSNLMSQRAFAQGIHSMSGVAKKALDKQARDLSASLPETVRASATAASLKEANPLYSDPAFAPFVDTLSAQLRLKNPDATPKQITNHVNNYLDGVATMLKTGKPMAAGTNGAKTKAGAEPTDWGNFFLGEEQAN